MNSKILYGAAFSALLLTACSQDSILDAPVQNDAAISYGVTSGSTTRAAQSLCNTSMPAKFKVSAYKTGTTESYFEKDEQKLVEGSNPVKYEGTYRYWPTYNLDFHAWTNDGGTYSYDETAKSGKFTNFTPAADAKDQLDLVYASMPNQNRQTVKLNFRHALSQIVFNARNESGLDIKISGVKVKNVNTVGTYTMKNADTSDNYQNHNPEDPTAEDIRKGLGEWSGVENSQLGFYTTTFAEMAIKGNDNVVLTDADHNGNVDGSLLLLPQTQDAWDPSKTATTFEGAYFTLNVVITDPNNGDKEIWNGETAVPVKIDWKQGVRYRYTFVFTNKGAGFTPDPNDPQPVLSGIELEVKTDDFVPVEGSEIPKEPEQPEQPETYNFKITLDGNGGTPSASDFTYTAEDGTKLPLGDYTATRDEYDFVGWSTNPNATAAEEIILNKDNLNVTLYAVWESQYQIITLSFNTNGETAITPLTQRVKKGEEATFELPKTVETADESYALEGWLTAAPAIKIIAADADDVEGLLNPGKRDFKTSKDMTLYAIYRETENGSGGGGDKPIVKD